MTMQRIDGLTQSTVSVVFVQIWLLPLQRLVGVTTTEWTSTRRYGRPPLDKPLQSQMGNLVSALRSA